MNLDKHRESLVKYCYDISKVACGVAVLNPAVSKAGSLGDVVIGLVATFAFLLIAIFLEEGGSS